MFDFLDTLMAPLYWVVSGILLLWHELFSTFIDPASGWSWALAIVGLTITIRAALIPLFVRQIKSSRNMQLLQPQMKELQKKYGHDRERLAQEQMKLWKETGTNPFASCLPLLLQMPVFIALFQVIDRAARRGADGALGLMDAVQAEQLQDAVFLGGRIADTLISASGWETRIIAIAMVVTMCATQFVTQRQLMSKNMPPDALNGPYAQQQKLLLYVLPFAFAAGGIFFPVGVLVYWTFSNFWTMGQQFYVIRQNPAPGTPAFKAKQERDAKKGKSVTEDPMKELEEPHPREPQRNQPQRQTRNQRQGGQQRKPGSKPSPNKKKKKK